MYSECEGILQGHRSVGSNRAARSAAAILVEQPGVEFRHRQEIVLSPKRPDRLWSQPVGKVVGT